MKEFATHKDGKPRFYLLDTGNTLIVDAQGYHEFCGTCKRLVFEYLGNGMYTTSLCKCTTVSTEQLITQLYQVLDQCQDVEAVKRMLMMYVSRQEMIAP